MLIYKVKELMLLCPLVAFIEVEFFEAKEDLILWHNVSRRLPLTLRLHIIDFTLSFTILGGTSISFLTT